MGKLVGRQSGRSEPLQLRPHSTKVLVAVPLSLRQWSAWCARRTGGRQKVWKHEASGRSDRTADGRRHRSVRRVAQQRAQQRKQRDAKIRRPVRVAGAQRAHQIDGHGHITVRSGCDTDGAAQVALFQ